MPRTVKPPDERRQELLDIGINLFLNKGSAGVSIQSVIKQADVATGLFYYYFKSKEAFLEEAIICYVSSLSDHLIEALTQNDDNALTSIKKALSKFSTHFEEVLPLMRDEVIDTPEFHIVMHSLLQRISPALVQLIIKGTSQGVFHVVSPAVTASFILNGLVGILHADKSNLTDEETGQEIERMVLSALGVDKL